MPDALAQQLEYLPEYLSRHLLLSLVALAIGVAISLPLAIGLTRTPRLKGPVMAVASAIQTIPSLALLALMVPLLGRIGMLPATIALVLYSMLPVLRNTVTGIETVDPDLTEAGRGMGMTDSQLLRQVELPLALPMIIAGIRTATVWVVGIATLSTPVGATSLGNYIFSGLQTQNTAAVLVGCVAAAALALLLDGLVRLIETAVRRRSRAGLAGAVALIAMLLAAGLAPLWTAARDAERDAVVIGTKTFTEQYILAGVIGRTAETAGAPARVLESLGSSVVFDALVAGRIDAYVDYTGTLWANQMGRDDNPGSTAVLAGVRDWLAREHGIRHVIPLGFENAYALAMPANRARALGVRSIEDLVRDGPGLVLGGDYEFFDRPEWAAVEQAYGLRFARQISMDSTLMYSAVANGQVDVIAAFSTDGRIAAFDLQVLDDPREALPPYDAVLLIAGDVNATVTQALSRLAGRIGNAEMRAANRSVDVDGESPEAVAARLHQTVTVP